MEPMQITAPLRWSLPPSKSHMIRWMTLVAQSSGRSSIHFSGTPGLDICSMADCLETLGARFERKEGEWIVTGVGQGGFKTPQQTLDCGNSGTAARFLMAIAAGMKEEVRIGGDRSLRSREMSGLTSALRNLGCSVSGDSLPLTVTGPLINDSTILDLSSSSQPLSAILLASPSFSFPIRLEIVGSVVSRGYYEMSFDIAVSCGSKNNFSKGAMEIVPWEVDSPESVTIPAEVSLLPVAMLISELHGIELDLGGDVSSASIVNLSNGVDLLDLRDESDIICPAAVLMAIGRGGRITGVSHARGKESNRIETTINLLRCFGMDAEEREDGLEIPGHQSAIRPTEPVETFRDHRLAMTAMALASRYGGVVSEPEICAVSDPDFITRLLDLSD